MNGDGGVRPGRLRLTRRGRVVVGLALALLSAVTLAVGATASVANGPADLVPRTVVRSGDTLWRIATRELPDRDPYAAIDEIRQLNGLDGYTVHPGQHLRLPTRR